MNEIEHFFQCPYCWQNISMILDPNGLDQEYVEDCEVCCQPIKLRFKLSLESEFEFFNAVSIEQ